MTGRMNWTDDGMDDRTDSREASFLIPTSFTIYDNTQICLVYKCVMKRKLDLIVNWTAFKILCENMLFQYILNELL